MEKILVNGYIYYGEKNYTFTYGDNKLTLICFKNTQDFLGEYIYIDYFEGFTLDGFDIAFYIDREIYYKDGCYICFPKAILVSRTKNSELFKNKFDSISLIGGIINRFYSNKHMIQLDYDKTSNFKIKEPKETVSTESINLENLKAELEFSIMKPGWKDDGSFTFGNYDSILRVKYLEGKDYKQILKNLVSIERFFKFCSNRNNISFEEIYLEIKNKEEKYEKIVDIYIPFMVDSKPINELINYDTLEGKISNVFAFLDTSKYIFSNIPDDDTDFYSISNKDYVSSISCFQSIFQSVNGFNYFIEENNEDLSEAKKETIEYLEKLSEKYKGINGKRRKYLNRFIHIINSSNLKLEKQLEEILYKYDYVLDSIFYKYGEQIKKFGISESCERAVETRDNITHDDIVKLSDVDIGMYKIIQKINYIMILQYSDVNSEKIKKIIEYLSIRKRL